MQVRPITIAGAVGSFQIFRWPRARYTSGTVVVSHQFSVVSDAAIHVTTASEKPLTRVQAPWPTPC